MKQLKVPSHFTIHGHRGSRGTHPENTLPSFEEAAHAGAQFIELDVRLTKDDVWLVYHDPQVSNRLCARRDGKRIDIAEHVRSLTSKDIRARFSTGAVAQAAFPKQHLTPNLPLPTLAEVLNWRAKSAPNTQLNIEVKMDDELPLLCSPSHAASQMIQILREWKSVSTVQLQSFDHRVVEAALKLEPSMLAACLFEQDEDFATSTRAHGAQIAGPDFKLLTPQKIHACHKNGVRVIPWTVNLPEDWERLISWNVDGIITDFPRDLLSHIAKN